MQPDPSSYPTFPNAAGIGTQTGYESKKPAQIAQPGSPDMLGTEVSPDAQPNPWAGVRQPDAGF